MFSNPSTNSFSDKLLYLGAVKTKLTPKGGMCLVSQQEIQASIGDFLKAAPQTIKRKVSTIFFFKTEIFFKFYFVLNFLNGLNTMIALDTCYLE